jgi:hypothetical protein
MDEPDNGEVPHIFLNQESYLHDATFMLDPSFDSDDDDETDVDVSDDSREGSPQPTARPAPTRPPKPVEMGDPTSLGHETGEPSNSTTPSVPRINPDSNIISILSVLEPTSLFMDTDAIEAVPLWIPEGEEELEQEDEQLMDPGVSWKTDKAQDEMKRAMDQIVDREFMVKSELSIPGRVRVHTSG